MAIFGLNPFGSSKKKGKTVSKKKASATLRKMKSSKKKSATCEFC